MKPRLQLKQTVTVKVSVRTRMMYAAAGITIAAIIAGTVIFLYSNLGTSKKAYAAVSGDYRSVGTGLWSNVAIWEKYNGTAWAVTLTAPNSTNGVITIQSGSIVTMIASTTVDQVIISSGGEIYLNSGVALTIANGTGTDLDVFGILKNSGVISINSNAAVAFENGGKYDHNVNGSNIITSTWNTGSTCEVTGITTNKPGNLNQSFYNFTWNCPGQTSSLDFNAALTTVNGNLTLVSTGISFIQFDRQGNNSTLNIGGNMLVQGGKTYCCLNGDIIINIAGNYVQTGGNFNICKAGGTAYGNTSMEMFVTGDVTISGGTIDLSQYDGNNSGKGMGHIYLSGTITASGSGLITETSATAHGGIFFDGTLLQYCYVPAANISSKVDFIVMPEAILRLDNQIVPGAGNFTLLDGGGLMMGSADGITISGATGNVQVTGTRSYGIGADYTYNGVVTQNAGNGLPSTVHNLTLDNSNGLTLSNTVAVSNLLTLTNGIITTGSSEVYVTNNSTSAIIGYSGLNYINGNLRRMILTTGTYNYPVGTSSQYELATLTMNNLDVVKNILVNFNNPHTGTTPNPGICIVNGSSVVGLLNYGFWNITPDVAITTGNYNLTLNERGYTNGGTSPNAYAIVTRPTTASNWISSGVHNNNTQSEIGGTVTAVRTVLSVTGNFAIGFSTYIMPIELVYFKAEPDHNSKVHLMWETASENNTNYFIVQRSPDQTTWENIDTVDATGNSFATVDYSIYDKDPIKGESYYRLKQCDVGLTYTYSDMVTVNIGEGNSTLSNDFEAYPNPTHGILNIFVTETTNRTMIRIYDIKGALIKEIKPVDGGHTQIDLSGNLPGIYLVKVGTGGPDDISKRIVLSQ